MDDWNIDQTRDFVAHVSHEIRNSLNGIMGFTRLLQDTSLTEEQAHYAESLQTSSEHLLKIVNDILDISKIEAGKIELEDIEFDIRYSLELIYDTTAGAAFEKNISFNIVCDPSVPPLLAGDPTRLRQVLGNLLSNAVKFTDLGDIMLSVLLEKERDRNVLLKFSVKDTGIGIPEEHQKKIFADFIQMDRSTARNYGGTGLGLSIASRLVNMMGGELELTSSPGSGSTFFFSVPFKKISSEKHIVGLWDLPDISGVRLAALSRNSYNILEFRRFLDCLARPINAFTSSEGFLEFADDPKASGETDCILIDIHISEPDCVETLQKLRKLKGHVLTPVILVSSAGNKEDIKKYKELGISAYLTRPLKKSELHNAVALAVRKRRDPSDLEIPLVTKHFIRELENRLSILLVEDDPVNRKLMTSLLERQGHRVTTAENGQEAAETALAENFSLIIMDINIPVLDGYSAAHIIREHEETLDREPVPIIAVTADTGNGFMEKCRKAEISRYILKPIDPETLNREIYSLVHGQKKPSKYETRFLDAEHAVFASNELLCRCNGDKQLSTEIIDTFIRVFPEKISALTVGCGSSDPDAIAKTAHSIKGAALNTGAREVASIAADIEKAVSEKGPSLPPGLLSDLKQAFERFREAAQDV